MNATVAKHEEIAKEVVFTESVESSNPLANVWLLVLATLLGGTLFCTVVLVAWPILAKLFAG